MPLAAVTRTSRSRPSDAVRRLTEALSAACQALRRWIAVLTAVGLGLFAPTSALADPPSSGAVQRVALSVYGAQAATVRSEIAAALKKQHVQVIDSPSVIAKLREAATPEDMAKLARKAHLAAMIEGFVSNKETTWTLTLSIHGGSDGELLKEIALQAKGDGPEALTAKVRAELGNRLRPILRKARGAANEAASDAEAPDDAENEEEQPEPAEREASETKKPPAEEKPAPPAEEKPPNATPPVVWLSGSLIQDVAWIMGAADVCTEDGQANRGYSCFRQQGSQYLGTPLVGRGDQIASGVALATTRLVVGVDLRVSDRVTLGARVGGAFRGGGPTPSSGERFLPLHLEGRIAYFLSDRAYGSTLSPFVFAAGGVAQIDGHVTTAVAENPKAAPPPSQLDNPPTQTLDVWRKSGMGFAAAGAGTFIRVGQSHGLLLDVRAVVLFPSTGGAAALSAGYTFGL